MENGIQLLIDVAKGLGLAGVSSGLAWVISSKVATAELRKDVDALRAEVQGLKQREDLSQTVKHMQADLEGLKVQQASTASDLVEVRERLSNLEGSMERGFKRTLKRLSLLVRHAQARKPGDGHGPIGSRRTGDA